MKKNKYGSKKIVINGAKFDSQGEYERYRELQLLQIAGKISGLKRQEKFVLLPTQRDPETGKCIERPLTYIADFVYYDENGKQVVEDFKGYLTPEYKAKRKLMLFLHGIRIKETR